MIRPIPIADRLVGPGAPCFIVAELSANHGGRLERAIELVRAAKASGADAVKLQTYTPDTLTIDCDNKYFRAGAGTLWAGRNLYDLYREAYTPWDWHLPLQNAAKESGMPLFSTPFDETAVEFLAKIHVPALKVASFENVDLPLLRKIASTGISVLLSTGMATLGEIDDAVRTIRDAGGRDLVLLKCTSAYPAPPEEMNLATIPHMRQAFGVPVGLSDHTLGTTVPVAAVALGACLIEKHLTLSRADGGPDSAFSLEPLEFRAMVDAVRAVELALGAVHYGVSETEAKSRLFRRSLFVIQDIAPGERFTKENVRSIRPAFGLHPRYLQDVLGRSAVRSLKRGSPLRWGMIDWSEQTGREEEEKL